MTEPLFQKQARGRTITDKTERAERAAKRDAMFWDVIQTAIRVANESVLYSRGLYQIHPGLMLRLREAIERASKEIKELKEEVTTHEPDSDG